MDDLISRKAAIDVADAVWSVTGDKNVAKVWDQLKDLPSAQPETSILTVTVNPDSEEIERVAHKIKDAPVMVLPSAEPEIIRCRNCKFASGDSRICMKFGHSPIGELDFCAWAERRTDEADYRKE